MYDDQILLTIGTMYYLFITHVLLGDASLLFNVMLHVNDVFYVTL